MHHLTDIQTTNLRTLYAVRLGLERDAVDTCRMFSLHPRLADQLRALQPEQMCALVHAVGQISIFVPRDDLAALLEAPLQLVGALAAAHPPRPANAVAPA